MTPERFAELAANDTGLTYMEARECLHEIELLTEEVAIWRWSIAALAAENARLRKTLRRIAGNYTSATILAQADEPLSALIAHEALKDKP